MKIKKQIANIPIEKRTFNDYHLMAHGGLNESDMKAYNDIQNDEEFKDWVKTYFQDYKLWPGAVKVITHFTAMGINSEKAEFMNELPEVDAFILYKLGKRTVTGKRPDAIYVDDIPPKSK